MAEQRGHTNQSEIVPLRLNEQHDRPSTVFNQVDKVVSNEGMEFWPCVEENGMISQAARPEKTKLYGMNFK